MEKIRLKNGNEYDIIAGGFQMMTGQGGNELLRMIIPDNDEISFDSVEKDFSIESNLTDIVLLDPNQTAENVVSGYTVLKSVEKSNNYLIGHHTTPLEDGGYNMEEIRGAVYVVLLSKPDFQTEFERVKETVDMVVLNMLEGF